MDSVRRIFRDAGPAKRFAVVAFVSLLLIGCDRPTPTPTFPPGFDPSIVEFRVVAHPALDIVIIDRATVQQGEEDAADKPQADVVASKQGKVVGRWVNITPGEEKKFSPPQFHVEERYSKQPDDKSMQLLVLTDDFNVNRVCISEASPGVDDQGRPCVDFKMTDDGAKKLYTLTNGIVGTGGELHCLAIILDGYVVSAPRVTSAITDRGQITGEFTSREVQDMAAILNVVELRTAATGDRSNNP